MAQEPEDPLKAIINYGSYLCNMTVSQTHPDDGKVYCPSKFDGFGCWNYTVAGKQAIIPCPEHLPGFNPNQFAYWNCTENGSWQNTSLNLADYSKCLHEDVTDDTHKYGLYGMFAGFSLSIILLTIAQLIFFSFKQLRCDRITLHKNLFASYILTGLTKIIYLASVTTEPTILFENPIWCRVLQIFQEYAVACNFAWMLCEGFYLHTVLVWPFHTGKKLIYLCCGIGWGIPFLLALFYTIFRFQSENNIMCWMEQSDLHWIIDGPICLSLLLNIYFLFAIVFVLLTKLRGMSDNSQTRKVFRATMILVPLLGLQYILAGFSPKDPTFQDVYHITTVIVSSLQGTFVAIMYCFFDREAISVIKRWYNQQKESLSGNNSKRVSTYITMYTDPLTASNSTKTVDADMPAGHACKMNSDPASPEETVEMLTPE